MRLSGITCITVSIAMVLLVILMASSMVAEDQTEEEIRIYTSKRLVLEHSIASTVHVPQGIQDIDVFVSFYPQDDFRQTVLQQNTTPQATANNATLRFTWRRPTQGQQPLGITTTVETANAYLPIREKIQFPLESQSIPSQYSIYLEPSENIDINSDIIDTASRLASGKNDLFIIAHDVATWVESNIRYDLSSVTADVSQSASWTLRNKVGVCDELTSLYIAMMRSLGVPARFVSGISYTNSDLFDDPWGPHAWAEVYFPNYGWVPFDITYRQFGHIDASHISLKTSTDADQSLTRYSWTGTGNRVGLDPLQYTTRIIQYQGTVEEDVTMHIEPLYNQVGFESKNLLRITLVNTQDHYISTTLSIIAPQEITLDRYLVVLLKPGERKTISLPIDVPSLDTRYIYTMPVEVRGLYGGNAHTEFKVAAQYQKYTENHIAPHLVQTNPENNALLSTDCSVQPYAIAGEPFKLSCSVSNTGNVYYPSVQLCLDNQCSTESIGIGQKAVIEKSLLFDQKGTRTVILAINPGTQTITQEIPIIVHGDPTLAMDIQTPEQIGFKERKQMNITISPVAGAIAQDIEIKVYTGIDPVLFTIPVMDKTYILQVEMSGREFKEGNNDIIISTTYKNVIGKEFSAHTITTTRLEHLTFLEKVESTIRRTLRKVIR